MIIDNFCILLFYGLHKLAVFYNILWHVQSEKNIKGNVFKKVTVYICDNQRYIHKTNNIHVPKEHNNIQERK